MPPLDPGSVQQLIEKLSLVAILAWGVLAFALGWVVPASVHKAALNDLNDWKVRHDKLYTIAEMTLRAKVGGGA